ncbi:alcohol dehydrogenase catalytic domain-containing protein [Pseudoclavibacter chungangensis]
MAALGGNALGTAVLTQRAVARVATGARRIEVVERPVPAVTGTDVLLDVRLCGLCGSDAHIWRGDDGYDWVTTGRVLGHEIVGVIARTGPDVPAEWAVGDRVVPIAQTGCGACDACARDYANGCAHKRTLGLSRDGGAAASVVVAADALVRVPDRLPDVTAVLTEPASIAARAVTRGRVGPGDTVVVTGPGTVGILAALAARDAGADVVLVGTPADVRDRSAPTGALGLPLRDAVPPGFVPSVWIEAAGAAAALGDAANALPVQGRLVVVALYGAPPSIRMNDLVRKEIEVVTSYSSFRADYERAIESLVRHPDLGAELVRGFGFSEFADEFDAIGSGTTVKAALEPSP